MANGHGGKRPGSGRKVGSKNRPLTPREAFKGLAKRACDQLKVDPFKIIAEFAANAEDERMRFEAARELAKYLEPQLKAVGNPNAVAAPSAAVVMHFHGQPPPEQAPIIDADRADVVVIDETQAKH